MRALPVQLLVVVLSCWGLIAGLATANAWVARDVKGAAVDASAAGGDRPTQVAAKERDLLESRAPTQGAATAGLTSYYAQTSWPTVHRDSRNSDFAPFVAPSVNRVKWTALDGAATLLAPTIGPEGNLYITTGRGPGTSHLHAFDRDGHLLWESPQQSTMDDLDSGAVGSAPVVDVDGDVYVSDINQFWAFRSDGTLKWVMELPEINHPFVSSIITNEGFVGGITTNGKVVLVHREDGAPAVPILDLPGGQGPEGPEPPPGLWAGGLMDPAIIETVIDAFFGYEVEVANTPAVHPATGRIYITAVSSDPTQGVLYGIDIVAGELQIAFETPMGAGSGTSPTISPDGERIYAVGGDHVMVAVDAGSGDIVWQAVGTGAAASPAVGPDGTVYSGGGEFFLALDPTDGSIKWRVNYDWLAREFLHRRRPSSVFPTGEPVARTNSVVCVTANQVWIVLVLGYEFKLPTTGNLIPQPYYVLLCSVDPADGSLKHVTHLRDTNEGVISVGADGSLYSSHAARLTSVFHYAINDQLPRFWRTDTPPVGGLSALEPVSFALHATNGIRSLQSLVADAMAELPAGDLEVAVEVIDRALGQVAATGETVLVDTGAELDLRTIDAAHGLLIQAGDSLFASASALPDQPGEAIESLASAGEHLTNALAVLEGTPAARLDIGSAVCPNEMRTRPCFFDQLDLALLGTEDFDVEQVDIASLVLARVDGVGGAIELRGRLRPPKTQVVDIGAPSALGACECDSNRPDGIPDLVVMLRARRVARALEIGAGDLQSPVLVRLTGSLNDGTPFLAMDCVVPIE